MAQSKVSNLKFNSKSKLLLSNIDAFVFDFDGVLTDNLVYTDQTGKESVLCNRSDGLAFDILKFLGKPCFIISTEKNAVVKARSTKIKIPFYCGKKDKLTTLKSIVQKNNFDISKIFYTGNDLNDYFAMKICKYKACPKDSHLEIKKISNFVLTKKGGEGVVREILEKIFNINPLKTGYFK